MTQHHIDTAPHVSDEVRKTTCYMCACRCGINVHLRDGNIRYIEGNKDHSEIIKDKWVFERDISTNNPNWKLVETRVPEEDDDEAN